MIEPVSVPILLDVDISPEEYYLDIEEQDEIEVDIGTAINIVKTDIDPYEGPYEVDPGATEQYLFTKNKLMKKDVTVHEIPMGLATRGQVDNLF